MTKVKMEFNKAVIFIRTLKKAGYKAHIVGGFVRDYILLEESIFNQEKGDVDVFTNAMPEDIERVLQGVAKEIDGFGKNYYVIKADKIEIATYRVEKYEPLAPGKPKVEKAESMIEDLKRRDFTINTIVMTEDGKIIDLLHGVRDLDKGIIRFVGNPIKRIKEDPSRILRALYFKARFGFKYSKSTRKALNKHVKELKKMPFEAKGDLVRKVMSYGKLHVFLKELALINGIQYVFPELSHIVGHKQNKKYHHLTVFRHILEVVKAAEEKYPNNYLMVLSALLHDNAKALEGTRTINDKGQPTDKGHEEDGELRAYECLTRLKFKEKLAKDVSLIVLYHGRTLPDKPKKRSIMKLVNEFVPHCKTKEELTQKIEELFDFMYLDAEGFTPTFSEEKKRNLSLVIPHVKSTLEEQMFYVKELPVDGHYLVRYGMEGKDIGDKLAVFVKENFKTKEQIDNHLKRNGFIA